MAQTLSSNKYSTEQLLEMIACNANIQGEIAQHVAQNPDSHWRIMDIEYLMHTHMNIALDYDNEDDDDVCDALTDHFNKKTQKTNQRGARFLKSKQQLLEGWTHIMNSFATKSNLVKFLNMKITLTGLTKFDGHLEYGQVCLFNDTHFTLIYAFHIEGDFVDDDVYQLYVHFETDIIDITNQLRDAESYQPPNIEQSPHLFTKCGKLKQLSYDIDKLILDADTRAVTCLALETENHKESLKNIAKISEMVLNINNRQNPRADIPLSHAMYV